MFPSRPLTRVATLMLVGVLAACGASSENTASTGAAEATSGGAATAPSTTTSDSSSAKSEAAVFPVTIKHAFGETTIAAKPERVATVAWANHEVPLALGVVPAGMAKATWGDDDGDGILPWVEDKLTELGGETPALFDETDGIDFEGVANTNPDVILASYSGLSQDDYDQLSEIAPVVAYPETAWTTSMDEMITMNAEAIGMKGEGEQLVADLTTQVTDSAAEHPALQGKTALFAWVDPKDMSKIGYYTTGDPRAALLEQVGLDTAQVVKDNADATNFFQEISAEEVDKLADVDIIVTYGDDTGELLKTLQGNDLLATIPAVKNGAVVSLVDNTPLAAAANPSPLDIPWGLNDYLDLLDAAAAKAP